MSAQPQLPPGPQPQRNGTATALLEALIRRNLEQLPPQVLATAQPLESYPALPNPDPGSAPPLYGEPPGEGYLYADAPEIRQATLIKTTPEFVRDQILRAMEVIAQNVTLPFNEEGAAKNAESLLRMAQAYLLIDPTVDAEGVPVVGQQMAQAAGQLAVAHGSPPPPPAQAAAGKPGEAHGTVKPGKTVGGLTLPPRVLPGQAAQILQTMHEGAETVLKGARGSRPVPQPRVGA